MSIIYVLVLLTVPVFWSILHRYDTEPKAVMDVTPVH